MTSSKLKRLALPTALVVGGVTAGSFLAPIGFAAAQDGDSGDSEADDQSTENNAESDADSESDRNRRGRGQRGQRLLAKAEVLEEVLGLTAEEIRAGMTDGKSLADLAAEQGVESDALVEALIEAANERIDEALAEERIDADRAEELRADLDERVAEMVERTPPEDFGERGDRSHRGPRFGGSEVLEDVLGLTAEEIRAGLADGKSLADLAAEQGVSTDDVAAALVDAATERIDEAVDEGKIDAEQAEDRKAELEERIDEMIEAEPGEFRSGRGHRGHGGDRGPRGESGDPSADDDVADASF